MKTAISIPDGVFEEADRVAKRLGVSRSELYVRAITQYLTAHRGDGVTEALDRVYEGEEGGVDPVLAAMQAASLVPDEW